MAATYSSFMATRFYNPIFNTALFDGPIRIYFSKNYESVALKIYHLLQTEYLEQWNQLRESSLKFKDHIFLMMYSDKNELHTVFSEKTQLIQSQEWEEGLAIGFCQPQDDVELVYQLEAITKLMASWLEKQNCEVSL
jgi:hypothetical protein